MLKKFFACLFSVHNIISLSHHEQVCLTRLRFERYFSHNSGLMIGEVSLEFGPDDRRSISPNVALFNIFVHEVINLKFLFKKYNFETESTIRPILCSS